mgnify:FL=1
MAILDSSAIIHILKGTEKGKLMVGNFNDELTTTTSLCIHETLLGTKEKEREATLSFLQSLEVISFDKESALESVKVEETKKE